MFSVLSDLTYRRLFFAQVVALLGTGLATVALGLLAFDIAGQNVALVLGGIFTIKMVAYVVIGPIAGGFADRVDRRRMLVALDLIRASVALMLPFVSEVWQVYVLIFILQAASAAFTPTFQATIPDVLTEEARYTRALSLSRLAYDLESIISPTLAAVLLLFVAYNTLFVATFVGFIASGLLVLSVVLPAAKPTERTGIYDRTTRGIRIYLATPRLRGLLALSLAVSSAGAMVLVNTVAIVRSELGLSEVMYSVTMFAFGFGSMLAAFALPAILDRLPDRPVMLTGAAGMVVALLSLAAIVSFRGLTWEMIALTWVFLGIGYSAVLTPSGRLIRRSSHPEDRPALFAAQFALSHACWLMTYPLAGWAMTRFGALPALVCLACLAGLGLVLAMRIWPKGDPVEIEHIHETLPLGHPHIQGQRRHSHALIIDDDHPRWATRF